MNFVHELVTFLNSPLGQALEAAAATKLIDMTHAKASASVPAPAKSARR